MVSEALIPYTEVCRFNDSVLLFGGFIVKDYLIIAGFIIGVILTVIGKKKGNRKALSYIGLILIAICFALALPDMINGFIDGYNAGRKVYND